MAAASARGWSWTEAELAPGPCRAVLAVAFAFYRILGKLNTHTQTHAHTQRCS